MSTKQEIIDEVCNHLGISSFYISTGSTEPKDFLLAVADQLGIKGLSSGMDKQEIGKLLVEASGSLWLPDFDSSGGTITKEGLIAIAQSVFKMTGGPIS
jgi:hypothetical protein